MFKSINRFRIWNTIKYIDTKFKISQPPDSTLEQIFKKGLKLNFWLALNILLKTLLSQFQKYRLGIVLTQKRGTYWRVNILVLAVNQIENKNPENHNAIVNYDS